MKIRKIFLFFIKFGVSVTLLFLLYKKTDFDAFGEKLECVNFYWLFLAGIFLFLNTFISSLKWRILLCADGIKEGLWNLFASHLTGSFFSLFLPSTIGGDAYRIADIGSRTEKTARTFASVLVDRLTGFLALAIYGLVASLVFRHSVSNWDNRFFLFPAVALAAIIAIFSFLCAPKFVMLCCRLVPGKRFRDKIITFANEILDAVRIYLKRGKTPYKVMALSFLFQLDVILFVWAVTMSLGLQLPFLSFFLFVPLITLMEMIPISIFGIGLRDMGYSWFMSAVGRETPEIDAGMTSLIYVSLTVIYVSFGGILFIFRQKKRKGKPCLTD